MKNYFELNPFNEKYLYIFTGDYVDRGIQNKEVLELSNNNKITNVDNLEQKSNVSTKILSLTPYEQNLLSEYKKRKIY